jgi:hypothetical protein
VSLSRETERSIEDCCYRSAQSLKDSTLGSVVCLPQGVRASPSERIRVEKSQEV